MKTRFYYFLTLWVSFWATELDASSKKLWFDSYNQENGLPFNQILCVNQDVEGWIWIGTNRGLSRFDGYRFKNFLPSFNDSNSIKGLLVRAIFSDHAGNLWVGTENGGLNLYDRDQETFLQPLTNDAINRSLSKTILDIDEDKAGNLWLATMNGVLKMDPSRHITRYPIHQGVVNKLEFDRKGRLWIGTNKSIYVLEPNTLSVKRLNAFTDFGKIMDLFLDSNGDMWITTSSNGAYIVDPNTMNATTLRLTPENERTKVVRTVVEDKPGSFWIGTRGGLYLYDKAKQSLSYYSHNELEQHSIKDNSINSIFKDRNGDMWIGTRHGLSFCAKSKQIFKNYEAHPSDRSGQYLNSESVYAIWVDGEKNIWVGTEDGGINIFNPKTQTYRYLKKSEGSQKALSENCVKAFCLDNSGNLWIGSFHGGIDVLNVRSGAIRHFRNENNQKNVLASNDVWDFTLDDSGTIWVATSAGVDHYNPATDRFLHHPELTGEERINWIEKDSKGNLWMGGNNEVVVYNTQSKAIYRHKDYTLSFLEDKQGQYWLSTFDKGLAKYSIEKGAVAYYKDDASMSHNQFLGILEDANQRLWISTSNGLLRFDPKNQTFLRFNKKDGMVNGNFNYGAAYKAANGDLFFGGISGFTHFNPSELIVSSKRMPLVFTELRVMNRKVELNPNDNGILKKSISETNRLHLNYKQNAFSIEFASLNFASSENSIYSYFLEGLDKEWSEPSTNRVATYTNIDPGNYVLHVCSVINGMRQYDNARTLEIIVKPPFWKTIWFLLLLILGIGWVVFELMHFYINRKKTKMELVIERMRTNKLNELNNMKIKFFTNISHEIRTPLTLILTPLEKLHSKEYPPEEVKTYVDMMYKNTKNLNKLIDQLLDFRKLDSGGLKLELMQGDMIQFVAETVNAHEIYAKEKNIALSFHRFQESLLAQYDADKLNKILNNLLSNAIKFTGKNGRITVQLSLVFDTEMDDVLQGSNTQEWIELSVIDTGIGIPEENLPKIFDPFYQIDTKEEHTGTGIGLSFAYELVKLHHGSMNVESKPEVGSKFTFRIPYIKAVQENVDGIVTMENDENPENDVLSENVMLIVEDNADVRLLIKEHFKHMFHVFEAENGKEGWTMTLKVIPDVIVSDILMAEMNGFEFCRKVKNDERTSHIPFLMLTALHAKEHILKGLEFGADDYITKPFDLAILQSKIENIISIRNSYKEKFSAEMTLQPRNILIASPDQKFLQKAIDVVESHISDTELDIEKFAIEVGVSRMQLYRKLHALTDMTVKEFIRNIRLKRAAQLLIQDAMNVTEIAFAVGFKDVSHFGKCFRQQYGMNAKEYRNSLGLE